MKLRDKHAQETIKRLHSNPENWKLKEFKKAYFVLTGRRKVLTEDEAKLIFEEWVGSPYRYQSLDFSQALLLLSGDWFKPQSTSKMSKQVKVKYASGDVSTCSSPVAYKK
ncbi:hypothetical protein QNZ80_004598 [Vibrio parahaemolyticus]|uniref:hypothetical protein n=1 Tax=Vibrio TaxID=662 RepID=UPI00102A0104|nr:MULTISPECIES: hypothetical protein [Vibrio]ELB2049401.1 hypothetical protein [Vibrio parahaemolyticus]ELB2165991.1 hypothetical protein [Vibrio parahaemolyticus]ELB2189796.1 hypothetical protein [Vibrio parahaemolyticus]ELB2194911.1 hypothetical protein [Vibrio parahaemolyticus]ELB2215000.1 hypothetical protein [Vibrio parahaemolyticus]